MLELETTEWQALDDRFYLHPFTDHRALRVQGARIVERAEGVYIWDTDGRKVLDGLAGLGCVSLGYGRRDISSVAAAAMDRLSFAHSFFKSTNKEAIELAAKLTEIAPPNFEHVFLSTSGSEANETAIRMIRTFWSFRGKPDKRVLIGRDHAYHGSTAATQSLGTFPEDLGASWGVPLPGYDHIGCPDYYELGGTCSESVFGLIAAGWLEKKILEIGEDKVAAFFAEPMQGAGGAIVPPENYWREIDRICKKYDVLLVADEVLTGIGRTGHMWASVGYGAMPDIITTAKGLTSAYAPLSATIASNRIGEALVASEGPWLHGFTYSGHPMCCAVALKVLGIIESEGLVQRVHDDIGPYFERAITSLLDHPLVGDARARGLFAGIKLVENKDLKQPFDAGKGVGIWCMDWAINNGVALRAIGDTILLAPSLVITHDEIDELVALARKAFDATAAHFGAVGETA